MKQNIIDGIFARHPDLIAFTKHDDKIYMQFEGMATDQVFDVSNMIGEREKTLIELAGDMQIAGWLRDYRKTTAALEDITSNWDSVEADEDTKKVLITR